MRGSESGGTATRSMPRALGVLLVVTLLSAVTYFHTFEALEPQSGAAAAVVLAAAAAESPTVEPQSTTTPTRTVDSYITNAPTPTTATETPLPSPSPSSTPKPRPTRKPTSAPLPKSTPTPTTTSKPSSTVAVLTNASTETPSMAPWTASGSSSSSSPSSSSRDGSAGAPRLAYMFYVTSDTYACAALHLMDRLQRLVSDASSAAAGAVGGAELVVLHAPAVSDAMLARLRAVARVVPVDEMRTSGLDATWQQSLTKLHAFRDWGYDRVVYMDADSVPLQSLDHLFELPAAPLYAPRAYWLQQPFFASTLLVIEPSDARFDEIVAWARARGDAAGFDMDILNAFFKDSVQYLPGDYTVLNSDFRAKPDASNKLYATTTELKAHTKMVHFSCTPDGSYGKPWTAASRDMSFAARQGLDPLFAALFEDFWTFQTRQCK